MPKFVDGVNGKRKDKQTDENRASDLLTHRYAAVDEEQRNHQNGQNAAVNERKAFRAHGVIGVDEQLCGKIEQIKFRRIAVSWIGECGFFKVSE